jgi:hypothetical protein
MGFAKKWFYIDLQEKNVIKAGYRMPVTSEAWYRPPIMTKKMQGHIKRVQTLQEARFTAAHIVETFA